MGGPYQKCTVLTPTSLVHILWKKLCAGAPSTAGPAVVPCHRRKTGLRAWNELREKVCRVVCCAAKRMPTRADMLGRGDGW